jgi:hypothetical protein
VVYINGEKGFLVGEKFGSEFIISSILRPLQNKRYRGSLQKSNLANFNKIVILYSLFAALKYCFVNSKQFSVELRDKFFKSTVIFKKPKIN